MTCHILKDSKLLCGLQWTDIMPSHVALFYYDQFYDYEMSDLVRKHSDPFCVDCMESDDAVLIALKHAKI